MKLVRVAGLVGIIVALGACGGSNGTPSAPAAGGSTSAPSGAPSSGAGTPAPQAGGTANITFTGGIAGTLAQPTKVACDATPFNIYVSLVGPVGSANYDLELEAYAYTGSAAGTFTVGGTPNAGGQLGPAEQHSNLGSTSGTITLTSKSAGTVSMTLTDPTSGTAPVMVSGTWSCATV